MKKADGVLALGLLSVLVALGVVVCMEVQSAHERSERPEYNPDSQVIQVQCIEGYKFALYTAPKKAGLSQMLTLNDKGNLIPATCTESSAPIIIEAREKSIGMSPAIIALSALAMALGLVFFVRWYERKHPEEHRHTY